MGTRNRRERGKPETIFISCAYCLPGLGVATNERIGVRGRGPLGSDSRTGAKGDGSVESLDPGHCSARSYSLMDGKKIAIGQPTGAGLGQGDGWVDICALASEEIRGRVGPVGASSQERERDG